MRKVYNRNIFIYLVKYLFIIFLLITLTTSCDIYQIIRPTGILEIKNNTAYSIIDIYTFDNNEIKSENLLFENLASGNSIAIKNINRKIYKVELILENMICKMEIVDFNNFDKITLLVSD